MQRFVDRDGFLCSVYTTFLVNTDVTEALIAASTKTVFLVSHQKCFAIMNEEWICRA